MNGRKEVLLRKVIMQYLQPKYLKATFGLTPSEYKKYKGLMKKNQNLRDHMSDLELIFTMLGERVTTEISQKENRIRLLRISRLHKEEECS